MKSLPVTNTMDNDQRLQRRKVMRTNVHSVTFLRHRLCHLVRLFFRPVSSKCLGSSLSSVLCVLFLFPLPPRQSPGGPGNFSQVINEANFSTLFTSNLALPPVRRRGCKLLQLKCILKAERKFCEQHQYHGDNQNVTLIRFIRAIRDAMMD